MGPTGSLHVLKTNHGVRIEGYFRGLVFQGVGHFRGLGISRRGVALHHSFSGGWNREF